MNKGDQYNYMSLKLLRFILKLNIFITIQILITNILSVLKKKPLKKFKKINLTCIF